MDKEQVMICILNMESGSIDDWIIANDLDDARRQAHEAGENVLASELYSVLDAQVGKHALNYGRVMLVS